MRQRRSVPLVAKQHRHLFDRFHFVPRQDHDQFNQIARSHFCCDCGLSPLGVHNKQSKQQPAARALRIANQLVADAAWGRLGCLVFILQNRTQRAPNRAINFSSFHSLNRANIFRQNGQRCSLLCPLCIPGRAADILLSFKNVRVSLSITPSLWSAAEIDSAISQPNRSTNIGQHKPSVRGRSSHTQGNKTCTRKSLCPPHLCPTNKSSNFSHNKQHSATYARMSPPPAHL